MGRGAGYSNRVAQVLSSVANPSRYPDRLDVPARPARALTRRSSRLMRERFLAPGSVPRRAGTWPPAPAFAPAEPE
ncbi:hypothetical protein SKAU_G00212870 [Synaphobranchus kaupii]|uniref:Uncharacterized protein n=1 Tax=Synaphobranchus kaupii TaxID=118154 RepID=A0A9Q1F9F0_SYNKA|nr:hypothetical protein SKAU_G00212870 [Synaphobranchus kaupii]